MRGGRCHPAACQADLPCALWSQDCRLLALGLCNPASLQSCTVQAMLVHGQLSLQSLLMQSLKARMRAIEGAMCICAAAKACRKHSKLRICSETLHAETLCAHTHTHTCMHARTHTHTHTRTHTATWLEHDEAGRTRDEERVVRIPGRVQLRLEQGVKVPEAACAHRLSGQRACSIVVMHASTWQSDCSKVACCRQLSRQRHRQRKPREP